LDPGPWCSIVLGVEHGEGLTERSPEPILGVVVLRVCPTQPPLLGGLFLGGPSRPCCRRDRLSFRVHSEPEECPHLVLADLTAYPNISNALPDPLTRRVPVLHVVVRQRLIAPKLLVGRGDLPCQVRVP